MRTTRLKKYLKAYKRLTGEPVYSVYAARQEHPNAYDPWTEEADDQLRKMWSEANQTPRLRSSEKQIFGILENYF